MSRTVQYLSFCVWLPSVSVKPSRFIHAVARIRTSFLLKAEYRIVCVLCLRIYPSPDTRAVPTSWLLGITLPLTQVYKIKSLLAKSFGNTSRSGIAGPYRNSMCKSRKVAPGVFNRKTEIIRQMAAAAEAENLPLRKYPGEGQGQGQCWHRQRDEEAGSEIPAVARKVRDRLVGNCC